MESAGLLLVPLSRSGVCSLSVFPKHQLSRIAPSHWLALALEWAPFGTVPVPQGPL